MVAATEELVSKNGEYDALQEKATPYLDLKNACSKLFLQEPVNLKLRLAVLNFS